jgi:DNA-directed RNA polymerase specialized sigma subunit
MMHPNEYSNPLADGGDMADPTIYGSDTTEWLMMPNVPDYEPSDMTEIVAILRQVLSALDETDQRMIHLIYYERNTFQEAARKLGLRAKSHTWRKTKAAMENFAKALKENPRLMIILEERYGI